MNRESIAKVASKTLQRRSPPRARARTEEQKQDVRENLIAVGRHLFMTGGSTSVSLRRIASTTGYSPATVYKYFRDQHELFVAIREYDLSRLVANLETVARNTHDPENRLRAVFLSAVKYWIRYPDQFCFLFSFHPEHAAKPSVPALEKSASVLRSYDLYYRLVEALFLSYDQPPPCTPRFATDAIIAATHGIISLAMHTGSMEWSNPTKLTDEVLNALLAKWRGNSVRNSET